MKVFIHHTVVEMKKQNKQQQVAVGPWIKREVHICSSGVAAAWLAGAAAAGTALQLVQLKLLPWGKVLSNN